MKRIVEIDDTLDECVEGAIEEIKECLLEYLAKNPDTEKTPCISNDLDYSGRIHEIVDGSVPIYTKEIDDIFYLRGNEVEEAFDNAGIGEKNDKGWPMGWKPAAIYCYIEEKVHEWYSDHADEVFEEWQEAMAAKTNEGIASLNSDSPVAVASRKRARPLRGDQNKNEN